MPKITRAGGVAAPDVVEIVDVDTVETEPVEDLVVETPAELDDDDVEAVDTDD